jgi:hypothetical protein
LKKICAPPRRPIQRAAQQRSPAAIPEFKNKSTAKPRNTVENSFNSAGAKKDRTHAVKYDLKSKPTSTARQRRSDQ